MQEVKTADCQSVVKLAELDNQDIETYEQLMAEPMEYVYFPKDPQRDIPHVNADGSLTWFAKVISINGIKFRIPVETKCPIPRSIYLRLKEQEQDIIDLGRKVLLKPNQFTRVM